jgi:hypothetical protein
MLKIFRLFQLVCTYACGTVSGSIRTRSYPIRLSYVMQNQGTYMYMMVVWEVEVERTREM